MISYHIALLHSRLSNAPGEMIKNEGVGSDHFNSRGSQVEQQRPPLMGIDWNEGEEGGGGRRRNWE